MVYLFFFGLLIFFYVIYYKSKTKNIKYNYKIKDKSKYNNDYEKLLHTPEWYRCREKILSLHNYTCDWCGTNKNLQVHHKKYLKFPNGKFVKPWEYNKKDLMCLCEFCHKKYHAFYKVNTYYCKYNSKYDVFD